MITLILAIAIQDQPVEIPKSELPKLGICNFCALNGSDHGEEKVVAGFRYKGETIYLCNTAEAKNFKADPTAYLPPVLPRPAPSIEFTDTNGTKWELSKINDKVVMVDFWATWCKPCKEMMPVLEKLRAKHHDKGFELLSISIDEKKADFDKFMTKSKHTNPFAWDSSGGWQKLGIRTIPMVYLIKNGQIIAQWNGKRKFEQFESVVLEALNSKN